MKKASETKKRYNDKTYERYTILFRKTDDAEYIDYMDCMKTRGMTTTEIIKKMIDKIK